MAGWVPEDLPLDTPSAARMYDYFLGGYHNFAVDRRAADAVAAMYPDFPLIMRANRAFLRRAVRFLVAQGVDQFLDLGSGIPTVGNVHEIAQAANPAARVVYVDTDPVAVAHSEAILRGNPRAAVLQADARRPAAILAHPTVRGMLDPGRPTAVLLVAMLHFVTDDDEAAGLVATIRDALPPGGYLVLTHGATDAAPREAMERVVRRYDATTNPTRLRSRAEVAAYFAGLSLVEPGLVLVPRWRPDGPDDLLLDDPVRANNWGGVGVRP
jgi:SAM-dependent methyltransferase